MGHLNDYYQHMVEWGAKVGISYSRDPLGKCLRQILAPSPSHARQDSYVKNSKTYKAAKIGTKKTNLSNQFDSANAEEAWLHWRQEMNNSDSLVSAQVMVDRKSHVYREVRSGDYGCLDDVVKCVKNGPAPVSWEDINGSETSSISNPPPAKVEIKKLTDFSKLTKTEKQALIKIRINQSSFRKAVLDRWGSKCAVTECELTTFLRASHIKPWCECTDKERMDPDNGLSLLANIDVAFDAGLISFADDGALLIHSQRFSEDKARKIGIDPLARLQEIGLWDKRFLKYHRQKYSFPEAKTQ